MSALGWTIIAGVVSALVAFVGGWGLGRRQDSALVAELQEKNDALERTNLAIQARIADLVRRPLGAREWDELLDLLSSASTD